MPSNSPEWFRQRGYIHFDRPISLKKAESIVLSPEKVCQHSFWPLIDYEITSEKLVKSDSGKLEKKPKARGIRYAAHIDSHIYAYYAKLLSALYEKDLAKKEISSHVLAFRSLNKSNVDFAYEAFSAIKDYGQCGVVCVDISGFFDNLDHKILKEQWTKLLGTEQLPSDHYSVFKSLTRFSYVQKETLFSAFDIPKSNHKKNLNRICSPDEFRTKVRKAGLIKRNNECIGIPQGSPISALLSNIYMTEFDQKMSDTVKEWGGHYFRYCDDMLFIVPEEFRNDVAGMVVTHIKQLHLEINTKKTEIRRFHLNEDGTLQCDKPLQYLGFLFTGQQILIRSAAFARFSERMKRGVRLAKRTRHKRNRIRLSKGERVKPLYKQKLYERYSHLGKRNFIRYGQRAARTMNSAAIRKQLKPLWQNLQDEIDD